MWGLDLHLLHWAWGSGRGLGQPGSEGSQLPDFLEECAQESLCISGLQDTQRPSLRRTSDNDPAHRGDAHTHTHTCRGRNRRHKEPQNQTPTLALPQGFQNLKLSNPEYKLTWVNRLKKERMESQKYKQGMRDYQKRPMRFARITKNF